MNKEEVFKEAINQKGINYNFDKLSEETSELNTALMQFKHGRIDFEDVASEIADVEIMIELFKYMFRYHEKEFEEWYNFKFNRMVERYEV